MSNEMECADSEVGPLVCLSCNVKVSDVQSMIIHVAGKRHKRATQGLTEMRTDGQATSRKCQAAQQEHDSRHFVKEETRLSESSDSSQWPKHCSLCNVKLTSEAVASSHYRGKKHKSLLAGAGPGDDQHSDLNMETTKIHWTTGWRQCSKCPVLDPSRMTLVQTLPKSKSKQVNPQQSKPKQDKPKQCKPSKTANKKSGNVSSSDYTEQEIRAKVVSVLSKQDEDKSLDIDDIAREVRRILLSSHEGSYGAGSKRESNSKEVDNAQQQQQQQQQHGITNVTKSEQYVDECAVFRLVVKAFSGRCEVRQLISEAQHLFSPELDVVKWLLKSKSFKVFKRKDSTKLDESLVLVKMDKLKLCARYVGGLSCDASRCRYLHLCPDFVAGHCSLVNCQRLHSLTDEHNLLVLSELNLSDVFTDEDILSLLRCNTLFVCSRWNEQGQCSLSKLYVLCPYLHVCQNFMLGDCADARCKLGHDLNTPAAKTLFSPTFYKLDDIPKPLLCKVILLPSESIHNRTSIKMSESVGGTADRSQKVDCSSEEQHKRRYFDQLKQCVGKIQKKAQKWGSLKDIHLSDDVDDDDDGGDYDDDDNEEKFICEANIRKQCRFGAELCTYHHYPLPYIWQIKIDGVWVTTAKNSSTEAAFCDASKDSYTCILENADFRAKMTFDFTDMTCTEDNRRMSFPVRRLSTKSYMDVSERHDFHTTWIWYWQSDDGRWVAYGADSLPYQDVVEAKYLAKESACFVNIERFSYLLDLRDMTEINATTGRRKRIKRRPQLVTTEEVLLGVRNKNNDWIRHFDKALLPSGWAPMNTRAYTTPDLVPLDEKSLEFAMAHDKFFATMDNAKYTISVIFRVQNLALWEKYIRKRRVMQQTSELNDVNEKYLFHGTSSEDVVNSICREGFDWRVCGKNGDLYGNGSYFANDARYVDNYCTKSISGKQQMFLSLVMIGRYAQGEPHLSRPPAFHNSCVDDLNNPNIYVIFHDDQTYPNYLIEYRSV